MLNDKIKHYRADAEYYDYFKVENPAIEDEERRRMQFLRRTYDFKSGMVVVDCGSGGGWIAKDYLPENVTVVSTDLSDINLRKIKDKYDPENKGLYVVADLCNMPFKDNVFDRGASNDVYEHFDEPDVAAKEAGRCIKSGGKFFVSVPYKESIDYHICIHCNKPTPIHAHLHSFDDDLLRKVFKDSGMKITNMKPFINRALQITLVSYVLMRWMPYSIWSILNNLAGLVIKRYSRMCLTMVSN